MPAAKSYFAESLVQAWALGAKAVASGEGGGYIMVVSAGTSWSGTPAEQHKLVAAADKWHAEHPTTVAEMLLPQRVGLSNAQSQNAIDAGLKLFGRGRRRGLRFSGWTHTYFERMTGLWYNRFGAKSEIKPNRLLGVISKLNDWDRNAEAAFYIHTDLPTDTFRPRGGPCLQYVQFRAYGNKQLQIVGLYRAHDYTNKALGNMLGLQRLGQFVASRTGRTYTGVSVISLHPFCEGKAKLIGFIKDVTA